MVILISKVRFSFLIFNSYIRKAIRLILSPVWLLDNKMTSVTRAILAANVQHDTHWLDIGCGLKPYAACFDSAHYTGIDIEISGRPSEMKVPDKYFDGVNIPYRDSEFDGILCTQVLEHVMDLDLLLNECNRVLKMQGRFVISVPFVYREHEQPYDYIRFTSFGLALALSRNGFQVSQSIKCLSAIETIATVFSVYVSKNIGSKNRLLLVLTGFCLIWPSLIFSKQLAKILPDDNDLFCVLISSAIKTTNQKTVKCT